MEETITHYLSQTLDGYSLAALVLVYLGGVITSIGPCNMSMIPILMAYVGATADTNKVRSFWLSVFFTLGSSLTFALLGVIVSLVGGIFGTSKSILIYFAATVSVLVGLKMLGVLKLPLPSIGTKFLRKPQNKGVGAAFLMGMAVGLAGSQCGTPILFAILTLVMSKGKIAYGALLLFIYGLGRGIPVIVAGTFTGVAKGLPGLAKWSVIFDKIGGTVLIGIGVYFAWTA